MTTDEILDELLAREGGWRDQVTRPDGTIDPPTNLGITLPVLQNWRLIFYQQGVTTAADLAQLDPAEARLIYKARYIDQPGFTPANIPFEPLRIQLIDFGVNSGPERAIRWLQRVLGMPKAQIDGVLGPITISVIRKLHVSAHCVGEGDETWFTPSYLRYVNDALVAARTYMIDRATDTGSMRKADEEGVESRALSFFLAKP